MAIGKRKPARDIVNHDVGGGELGRDVEALILDVARQVVAEIAVHHLIRKLRRFDPLARRRLGHDLANDHRVRVESGLCERRAQVCERLRVRRATGPEQQLYLHRFTIATDARGSAFRSRSPPCGASRRS